MAVAARTPGPSDARVPCPLCGGLIHPIAGRCKHCKADLAAYRSTRPAAIAALPSLVANTSPRMPVTVGPVDGGGTSLHAPPAAPHLAATQAPHLAATQIESTAPASAVPYAPVAYAAEDSRPVLPPRPTGQLRAAPARSLWRNWPVIVIVLAVIAIAAAVVLMLWPPPSAAKADTRKLGPAPERMDTSPLPPQGPRGQLPPSGSSPDPWSNRNPVPSTPPPSPINPPPDPDDLSAIDPDDIFKDPFANPRGGLRRNPFGNTGLGFTGFLFSAMKHACDNLRRCPNVSTAVSMCALVDQAAATAPPPPRCLAAQRCLEHIDALDMCTGTMTSPADITGILMKAQDCMDVARC